MTSIIPRLNCSYCHSDGRYPVVIRVIRQRSKREIKTSLLISKEEFNNQTGQIVSHPGRRYPPGRIAKDNRLLADICSELQLISEDLYREKGEAYTADDIAGVYKYRHDRTQLFVYADSLIETLYKKGQAGTAGNYRSTCSCLKNFLGTSVLSFDNLTANLIDRFASHLRQSGKQENTITCYLKQLRALYNKALKDYVVKTDLQPFRNQILKEEPTRKRALSREDVKKLETADLTTCHKDVTLVRDLFMSSIHLRGMAFVDLCHATTACIEGDYLCYKRRKTGQMLRVRIEKPLKKLLARYADPSSPYLFSMLRNNNGDEYKAYLNAKSRLSRRIHQLGIRLNLNFSLTFHLARHNKFHFLLKTSNLHLI